MATTKTNKAATVTETAKPAKSSKVKAEVVATKVKTAEIVATKTASKTKVSTIAKRVENMDDPVVLNVAFKKDLELTKRIERAAHKHGKSKVKAGICDMSFTFSRKTATLGAISRIQERFGKDVTVAIAGAIA